MGFKNSIGAWLGIGFSGVLFGSGLVVSGMTNPAKVLAFLDVAALWNGTWDATLAFVMGGAVLTTFVGFRLVWGRSKPLFEPKFSIPTATQLDKPLIVGAALFGIGWGLAGTCPGPALANLMHPTADGYAFVAAMVLGILAAKYIKR
ncbi:MAG: DUF6691 family protein [Alphaproteobacteria bacterium]